MNKVLIWIAIIVAVVAVLFFVFRSPDTEVTGGPAAINVPITSSLESPSPETTPTVTPAQSSSPVKTTVKATVPPAALSYSQAMTKYAGFRIQFDERCQATPAQLVVKTGKSIMLDNRSGDGRSFLVGGKSYYIKGYGWLILPMQAPLSKLPATVTIGCGSATNVATIQIQK